MIVMKSGARNLLGVTGFGSRSGSVSGFGSSSKSSRFSDFENEGRK